MAVAVLPQRVLKALNSVRGRRTGKLQVIMMCARYFQKLLLRSWRCTKNLPALIDGNDIIQFSLYDKEWAVDVPSSSSCLPVCSMFSCSSDCFAYSGCLRKALRAQLDFFSSAQVDGCPAIAIAHGNAAAVAA
jgi:hypothetical protein